MLKEKSVHEGICDLLSGNLAHLANIEFEFESISFGQIVFQLNSVYYSSMLCIILDYEAQLCYYKKYVPYSLNIMPPSIIGPPYYLHKFAAEVYLSPIYAPAWPYMETLIRMEELCDSDE